MDFTNYITFIQRYYPSIICSDIKLIDNKILGIIKENTGILGIKSNGSVCKIVIPKNTKNLPEIKGDINNILKNIDKIKKIKYLKKNYNTYNHNIVYENNKVLPIKNDIDESEIKSVYDLQVEKIKNCQNKIINEKERIINGIKEYKNKINEYLKNNVLNNNCDEKIEKIHNKMMLENEILKQQILQIQKCKNSNEIKELEFQENSNEILKELEKVSKDLEKCNMKTKVIEGCKFRCKNKILNEKNIIIEKIKEYNHQWTEWVESNNIKTENNIKYINKLIENYNIINSNFKKLKEENEELKLKQNIKDVQLVLKNTINKQIRLLQEKDLQINSLTEEQIILKKELEYIKKLLIENSKDVSVIEKEYDYNNCYNILKSFITLNNILWRKMEIINKIEQILQKENLQIKEQYIYENFLKVKEKITNYIKFLNLEKYINSPNIQYLKSNSTKQKVPIEFCNDLVNILHYWNENKQDYKIQEQLLGNIYEDISGAIRVYIRIKPLIGMDQKEKSVITKINDSINISCPLKNIDKTFTFENIFDDTLLNINVFTGNNKITNSENLIINEQETELNSLYNVSKQLESGYNILLFSYGSNDSGKSTTLLGNNGIPGILHYILANLKEISNIKVKNVFEQYKSDVDFNFRKIRGKIYNLIGTKFLSFNSRDENENFKKLLDIDTNNINVENITKLIKYIEEYRINNEHIKTVFNQNSSRSHLYIILEIQFNNGNIGYLTIIDMAGRESPMDIYNKYINTKKVSLESIMSPEIGLDLIEKYKIQEIDSKNILDILKESFYINESLNHLLYYFQNINGNTENIKLQTSKYESSRFFVNPKTEEYYINDGNNCLTIPILNYIKNLGKKSFKSTKYIMICNIRQEPTFCQQTIDSLEFVKKISM